MKLKNGADALAMAMRKGGRGERPYLGYVLARTGMGAHEYVTWMIASDDAVEWECNHGNYFHDMTEAYADWLERVTRGTSYVKEDIYETA